MKKELPILLILIILCIAVSIANPQFLSTTNLQNTARLIGMFGIFSIGVGIVIITGGIDLSVGSVFSLLGVSIPAFWLGPMPSGSMAASSEGVSP